MILSLALAFCGLPAVAVAQDAEGQQTSASSTSASGVSDADVEDALAAYTLSGFMDWMLTLDDITTAQQADIANAQSMLESYVESGDVDLTDQNDAAALDNLAHAAEILQTIEQLRKSDECYNALYDMPDLYTSFTMMVGSAYTADVSIYRTAHVSTYSTFANSENLAWGYTDPTKGWYTAEKAYVTQAMEQLGYSADTLTTTQWSEVTTLASSLASAKGSTIGHYTNLFYGVSSGTDALMGVGYTTESYLYATTSSCNAASLSRYSSYASYSPDTFCALIEEYESYLNVQVSDGWNAWGTCEWQIDADGVLTIRPQGDASWGVAPPVVSASEAPWYSENASITSVAFEGSVIAYGDLVGLFYGCTALETIENIEAIDTSRATDLSYMFYNCSSLASLDLSGFDTSSVTDMPHMFRRCNSLAALDLSGFDTSSVTDMSSMFYACTSLVSLDLSGFDTSSVTDMDSMFCGCSSLTTLDLSCFDTSSVVYMIYMFYGCTSLTTLDLSCFDTSSVVSMNYMFYNCSALVSLDVSSFDTSSVVCMLYMFCNCKSLRSLDLTGFDTTSVDEEPAEIFTKCTGLRTIVIGENFEYAYFLPLPVISTYGTGVWADKDCSIYSDTSLIPTSTAATYYAVFPDAPFGTASASAPTCAGVGLGADVAFDDECTAYGLLQLRYTWYASDGTAVTSASEDASLAIDDALYGGSYYCVVSDASGLYTSTLATDAVTAEHAYVSTTVDATCTQGGSATYTCTSCGATTVETVEALGHDYELVAGSDATCTEDGYATYTCTRGDDTYTVTYAALGHDYAFADGTWSYGDDYTSATYTVTCTHDATHTLVYDAEVTVEENVVYTTYTAVVSVEGETYTDELVVYSERTYFTDAPATDYEKWYFEAVYALADAGYITGYTSGDDAGAYGVGDTMKRCDLVTVLWRIACPEEYANYEADAAATGAYDAANTTGLSDVTADRYYTAAVNWAVANGVVTGYTSGTYAGKFRPGASISFQEMCLVIARYECGGTDVTTEASTSSLLAGFTDGSSVASWARAGMAWCVENGLVSGYENSNGTYSLKPASSVTRERVATVIYRARQAGMLVGA